MQLPKDEIEQKITNNKELNQQKINQVKTQLYTPTETQKKYVYDVYDQIAPHFSHTRYKPWPKIQQFLSKLPDGSLVCDVGCGNGKYLGVNPNIFIVGTDRSLGLLRTAQEKNEKYELFAADNLALPIKSESFDAFISIAVIHHFSNPKLRQQALIQLTKILRLNGIGLIYVWAFEQGLQKGVGSKKFEKQDNLVPWNLHFRYEQELPKKIEQANEGNIQIDYDKKTIIYQRYYHVFMQNELQKLIEQIKGIEIISSYYDHDNWCCQIRKIG